MTGNPHVGAAGAREEPRAQPRPPHAGGLLSIVTERCRACRSSAASRSTQIGSGFYRVIARYGFMEEPDAIEVLG